MIMDQLRSGKFVKWVMIIVVITFVGTILFAWGMDVGGTRFNKTTVGEIGKRKIPFNTFNEELVNRYKMEKQNEEQSSFKMANLREEIFQQMVAQYILENTINDLKLKASPDELIQYFRTNPPQGIAQNPYFMTDSVFDTTKYYKFLDSPEAYNIPGMAYLESYHTKFTIPASQLQILISNTAKISDLEARHKILASEEKAEIEYLALQSSSVNIDASSISENEARKYYNSNPDSFKTDGMCELEYVAIPKIASPVDEDNVKKEMESIRERLKNNESFEALAFELSEDVTAKDSGDLGFFPKGQMVKPFEDAILKLKPGEVSEPVRTVYGYHLIKLIEIKDKGEKIRAKHILIKVSPSVETVDILKEKGDTLVERLKTGKSFCELALQEGLVCQNTGTFQKGSHITGFDTENKFISGLAHFAFGSDKEADVFENEGNVYVFHIKNKISKGSVPFELAKADIIKSLLEAAKMEKAKAIMIGVLERIKAGNVPLKDITTTDSTIKYSANADATREVFLPYLGSSSKAIYKAFSLKDGELTPVMEANRSYAIIRLLKKYPLSEQEVATKLQSIRQNLADQSKYMAYTGWFEKKKEKIKVVNNLDAFYNQ